MINGYLIDFENNNLDYELDIINECLMKTKKYSFHFECRHNCTINIIGKTCNATLCDGEYDEVLLFIKNNNFYISFINSKNISEIYIEHLKERYNINLLKYNKEVFYDFHEENYIVNGEKINLDFDDFLEEIEKSQNLDSFIDKNKQNQISEENNMQLDNLVQFKIQEKVMDTILKDKELSISKIMMLQSFGGGTFDISDMLKIKLIEKFSLNDDKEKMDYKQIALLNMVQNGKFDFQFFFALNLVDKMIDKDDDFAEIIKLEIINSSKNGFDSNKIMELIIQQKLLSTL